MVQLRLSEAIRLGAALRPQGFGALLTAEGRSCAFGAALEASGVLVPDAKDNLSLLHPDVHNVSWWTFYKATMTHTTCPLCKREPVLSALIPHLNDVHRWTREKIADFVAERERIFYGDDPVPAPPAAQADPYLVAV